MFNKDRIEAVELEVDSLRDMAVNAIGDGKDTARRVEEVAKVVDNNALVQRTHETRLETQGQVITRLAGNDNIQNQLLRALSAKVLEQDEVIEELQEQIDRIGTAADLLAEKLKLELVMKPEVPAMLIPQQPAELVLVRPNEAKKIREESGQVGEDDLEDYGGLELVD